MQTWQMQEAKMNLSDLIRHAKLSPQLITVRGNPEVVVLSTKTYSKMKGKEISIFDIMQKCPDKKLKLGGKRSTDSKLRKVNI